MSSFHNYSTTNAHKNNSFSTSFSFKRTMSKYILGKSDKKTSTRSTPDHGLDKPSAFLRLFSDYNGTRNAPRQTQAKPIIGAPTNFQLVDGPMFAGNNDHIVSNLPTTIAGSFTDYS